MLDWDLNLDFSLDRCELVPQACFRNMSSASGSRTSVSSLPLLEKHFFLMFWSVNSSGMFGGRLVRQMIAVDYLISFKTYDDKSLQKYTKIESRNIHFPIRLSFNLQSSLLAVNSKMFLLIAAASWIKSANAQKGSSNIPLKTALQFPPQSSFKCSKMAAFPHGSSC